MRITFGSLQCIPKNKSRESEKNANKVTEFPQLYMKNKVNKHKVYQNIMKIFYSVVNSQLL